MRKILRYNQPSDPEGLPAQAQRAAMPKDNKYGKTEAENLLLGQSQMSASKDGMNIVIHPMR